MGIRQKAELTLLGLVGTIVYLVYNPLDTDNTWISWVTLWIFLGTHCAPYHHHLPLHQLPC